jgi:hypothetical protein
MPPTNVRKVGPPAESQAHRVPYISSTVEIATGKTCGHQNSHSVAKRGHESFSGNESHARE